jgi:hypothetical protein
MSLRKKDWSVFTGRRKIKMFRAIFKEFHANGEQVYKVSEVVLCRYIPEGTFDIKSINRPYDMVLINPQDNPMCSKNLQKILEDGDINGFERRTLEFNQEYYGKPE